MTFAPTLLEAPWPARIGGDAQIMGIVNVTPDSFSDGGWFAAHDVAIEYALGLAGEGADILDIGGESTRPGAALVDAAEEAARILPVITALSRKAGLPPISVDTYKAKTARLALQAGASIVNDVWGLQRDEAMADEVAKAGAGLVIMHNRTERDESLDILADMAHFFEISLEKARRAGISRGRIALDPGIGFGKTQAQNIAAIRAIGDLKRLFGCAILLGVSRKSFLLPITKQPVDNRLAGTLATGAIGIRGGADIIRVHDVGPHRDMLAVMAAFA